VEAYSAVSGELLWKTDLLNGTQSNTLASAELIVGPVRIGGGVPWAGMSLDNARSRLYVSTGNPRPALYGVTRPGNNELSSSIVCIDTRTGAIAWSFQEVAHDMWDLDIPSPPVLTSIRRNGHLIDVVAAVTKIGNTILLERDSGKPVFDYRLKKAPVSQVPYETTAPYQPALELPEPFTKRIFERSDITDLSSSQKRSVELKTANAKFGFFEPPSIESKVALFGLHGGAEWPGGAVNPETGVLFVPSNQFPWMLRLRYVETVDNTIRTVDPIGDALYQQKCAGCHGVKREGYYESEFTGDKSYPSLVGITSYLKSWGLKEFEERHALTPFSVDATDLNRIATYLHEADILSEAKGNLSIEGVWQLLLDGEGYPGSKPPWGSISAINLNTGKKLWQVPFGEYDGLTKRGIPITGQPNFGGLLVSRGGLIFATGTIDKKVRAFNSDTGEQLWQYELPAAGSAPPSTYEIDGTQYLAVVATGGLFAGFKERSDAILAFKLSP
jgi:quinoprotein glucose dehydrogenase